MGYIYQKSLINGCFNGTRIELTGELFIAMSDYQRENIGDFGITHNFRITNFNQGRYVDSLMIVGCKH